MINTFLLFMFILIPVVIGIAARSGVLAAVSGIPLGIWLAFMTEDTWLLTVFLLVALSVCLAAAAAVAGPVTGERS